MVRKFFKFKKGSGSFGQAVPVNADSVYAPPVITADEAEAFQVKQDAVVTIADPSDVLKSYKRRWFVLLVISLLNTSNAMSWIAYAPVANFVDTYYGKQTSNFLSLTFIVSTIPIGFFAMWSGRRFGLRPVLLFASWANFLGAVIRNISSAGNFEQVSRLAIVMLGQCICACSYPFIMFLPTKVAADWFPSDQRTIANVIANLCNPIGILIANFMSPRLVVELSNIPLLHGVLVVPAAIVCALTTFGIRSSAPPKPPSHSAAVESMTFLAGLKKAVTSRAYLMLILALGTGIGVFNTLYTIMQQLLCARGYSNEFAGLCCVLMNLSGLVGSVLVGHFVDRTKLFVETIKVVFCLAVLSGIIFSVLSLQYNIGAAVVVAAMSFGFFGVAAYPLGFEMGVECLFPVAETTTAGLTTLAGQLGTVIFLPLIQFLSKPMDERGLRWQVCTAAGEVHVPVYDMTVSMIVLVTLCSFVACLFLYAFRPKYRRLVVDRRQPNGVADRSPNEGILEVKTILQA